MTQGIVIATSEATKDFLKPLIDSLPKTYPILVVGNGGFKNELVNVTNELNEFECGAIKHGKDLFDEFIFLMDTCLVKDPSFIEDVFRTQGSVHFMERFLSYIGKYESAKLRNIPPITNKAGAVHAETFWLQNYRKMSRAQPYKQVLPHYTGVVQEIYGDKRCVIENDFLIKYKKYYPGGETI
jgi:hypothetical protein